MRSLTLLFACIIMWAVVPVASASDQPVDEAKPERGARLQDIAARLQLTDEQKEQIAPILEQEAKDLKKVRDNTSLRRMQRVRRVRDITEKASKQIRALLTPEQQIEYDALRAEMREEIKQRLKEKRNAES